MLLDVQGCGAELFDPEIASNQVEINNEMLFYTGKLHWHAIESFVKVHKCNSYCNLLGLTDLNKV